MTIATGTPPSTHPLEAAVDAARAALAQVVGPQAIYLPTEDKEDLLLALVVLESQTAALKLATVAASGDVAASHGQRDIAAWLAKTARVDPVRARADERLATALDQRYPTTAAALAGAVVNVEQARVIAAALDALPARVGPEVRRRAEVDLIGFAGDHGPADLRRLGAAILHVACPEIADEEDSRRLADAERRALDKTSIRLRPTGEGTTRLSGVLPDDAAARFAAYLDAHANPRTSGAEAVGSWERCSGFPSTGAGGWRS